MASYPTTYDEAIPRSADWNVGGLALAQPVSLGMIALLAVAVHGPLLLMQLPLQSLEATNHIFFAQHYAQSWFEPWNEKWFGGFSQTTAPPLAHHWIALFSKVMSAPLAYMIVQLLALVLLTKGIYRYSRIWVGERSASMAAIGGIFLGSLALIVYQVGQLPTTLATALLLNAFAYLYVWCRDACFSAAAKGVLLFALAAAADHITFFAGSLLFGLPALLLAISDARAAENKPSPAGTVIRAGVFIVAGIVISGIALLPFWIQLFDQNTPQVPAPHGSRDNFLFNGASALNHWVVPFGAFALALPFIFRKGTSEPRLRPLFFGFFAALLMGLGGTTPVGRVVLGSSYESWTLDRFTFWATLLALPLVGLLAARIIKRFAVRGVVTLVVAAALSFSFAFFWMTHRSENRDPLRTDTIIGFLGRDGHDRYRYLTLGFGYNFAEVAMRAPARTVDGAYAGGRLLPEMQPYGWLRLDQARHYGATGMEALRAVLKHANNYGLKYIFVRDRYYEPLLAFAGWRLVESHDSGSFSIWSKEDVPAARPMDEGMRLPLLQRWTWGIAPLALSLLTIVLAIIWRERRLASGEASPTLDNTLPLRRAD